MHAVVPRPQPGLPPECRDERATVPASTTARVLASPRLRGIAGLTGSVRCFVSQPLPATGPAGGLLMGR